MKAELHCHLDGLLDPAMAAQLGMQVDLASCYPVDSVDKWLHAYAPVAEPAMTPNDVWLPRILDIHLDRLRAQGVSYAELFVSGLLFARDDIGELVDYFSELRARATVPDLEVQLVICIGRGSEEKLARQAPRIAALRRANLVTGVALAGPGEKFPVRPIERFFDEFRELGLGIEIHAGEFAGADSVRDALTYGRPDRLGHAIAAFTDEALLDEIQKREIHIEFCPTSNLSLGVVRSLDEHPIHEAYAREMSFSINTDDPGPFGCSLTSELALFDFDLDVIYANTMRAAFR